MKNKKLILLLIKLFRYIYWTATFKLPDKLKLQRTAKTISSSGLFDIQYYLEANPDINKFWIDPVLHFVSHGVIEKRDPHPLFSVAHYCAAKNIIDPQNFNPVVQYLMSTQEENIDPHPLFLQYYYLSQKPNLKIQDGISPLQDFIAQNAINFKSSHPLFDAEYYLEQNPDVNRANINPFLHFLYHGWKEGRNPHPLFDTKYYLLHYSSLMQPGENPLYHFLLHANSLNLNPNPYFDTENYLKNYPDVKNGNLNPLLHYILYGADEGRLPSLRFDPKFYLSSYPELLLTEKVAFIDFVKNGIEKNRKGSNSRILEIAKDKNEWKDLLPSVTSKLEPQQSNKVVSVVVPIYRDVLTTSACINSVVSAKNNAAYRLLLINDCSPEKEMASFLDSLYKKKNIEVYHNDQNLGFVRTVNKGMSLYQEDDVILLNSDTLVADYWLDRLVQQADSAKEIGTVTPFSNNATICNYPDLSGFSEFPEGENLQTFNKAFYSANCGKNIDIPTAVGFCMYIKRACLEEVGEFDYQTFGKGYGEENDFCLRASKLRWKHILAADVFVYHKGEVSFAGTSSTSKNQAAIKLSELYPDYNSIIARHLEHDAILPLQLAATAARYSLQNKPVVLIISHALGGGTETYIQQQLRKRSKEVSFLILRPARFLVKEVDFTLEFYQQNSKVQFAIEKDIAEDFIVEFLKTFNISRIEINHLLGFKFDIFRLIQSLKLPYEFFVHDYFSICPQINLTRKNGEYCGEPNAEHCNLCLAERPSWGGEDIVSWREKNKKIILGAAKVICPSSDVKERMSKYCQSSNFQVQPHLEHDISKINFYIPPLDLNEKLRVVLIGAMFPHKGSRIVLDVAKYVLENHLNIELQLIGYFNKEQEKEANAVLRSTGEFEENQLPLLINQINPHLIWFPARCPETFSFTLSAAIESGRPILASRIGALTERLVGREWTWLHPWDSEVAGIIKDFHQVRDSLLSQVKVSNLN